MTELNLNEIKVRATMAVDELDGNGLWHRCLSDRKDIATLLVEVERLEEELKLTKYALAYSGNEAKSAIDDLVALQARQRWVPVEEKPPDETEDVLGTDMNAPPEWRGVLYYGPFTTLDGRPFVFDDGYYPITHYLRPWPPEVEE